MKKFKPGKVGSVNWWESLSLEDKQKFKANYEKVLLYENKYPHLVDTTQTRISKLTGGQIHSIWRFKEHKFKI